MVTNQELEAIGESVGLGPNISKEYGRALLAKAVPQWLPIETMPEEGEFIVYMPNERRQFQVMYKNKNVSIIGGMFEFDLTRPSHWMPRPVAPSPAERKE